MGTASGGAQRAWHTLDGVAGKTALVLSAGGVFGAYQVGVWKALSRWFEPDLVVGASIGSINGWLIAGGCPPDELEQLWLEAGQHLRIHGRAPRRWSQGFLDMSAVDPVLAEVYGRFSPRTEYAAVITDVRRARPRIVGGREMTLRHLQASCAVPLALDLQRLDGRWYADGGLLSAVPLWAAAELGATRIIAVNCQPPAPLPWRMVIRAGRAMSRFRTGPLAGVEVATITPARPLGSFLDLLRYRRERVAAWIGEGERDGARV